MNHAVSLAWIAGPRRVVFAAAIAVAMMAEGSGRAAESQWAWQGSNGRMVYRPDAQGDRIMDFSNVGYRAGKEPIPDVPTVVTVSADANGNNDRARIQAAINQVAAMPLGADGFRGAVLLERGHYEIWGQLVIQSSGVVLRGESRWADGTVLHARGTDRRALISVSGSGSRQLTGPTINVIDKTVPVGMNSFRVDSTAGLSIGDTVLVTRPSTANWIHDTGMDRLDNPWQPGSKNLNWERTVTRMEGNRVFFDAPLTNSLEQQYGGATLRRFTFPGRIGNVGVENLRGDSDYASSTDENHSWDFVSVDKARNVWIRETKALHFAYAHVYVHDEAKWVTAEDCINHSPKSQITGGRRYAFAIKGQQNLVTGCESRDGRHDFVLHATVAGPNVFHNSVAERAHADSGPHHRWSTGGLFDNITVEGNQLNVRNRGNSGTGHGWAGANMVSWNSAASKFRFYNPPTAQNWAIGGVGSREGNAYYDSHGTNVTPDSLYEAQMADVATLREYRWTGGNGNWSDGRMWDNLAVPAVRNIQFRDYLIGDVDDFVYDGSGSVDDTAIDPAWLSYVQSRSSNPVVGFDRRTDNRSVVFTHTYQLDAGDDVIHGWLGLGGRKFGGDGNNDFLEIDGAGRYYVGSDLGWNIGTGRQGYAIDLGDKTHVLDSGKLSFWISDDTALDYGILSLTVATETPDPDGASVWIAGGGQATINSPVPAVGQVEVSGSGSRLVVEPGAELHVMRDVRLDAELRMTGGSLQAGTIDDIGPSADFDWTGGRLTVDRFGFDLVQRGGQLAPGASPGTMWIDGSYEMLGGSYEVEIAGLGDHDLVDIAGNATLDGTLDIQLLNGFVPNAGDTFDVLLAMEITLADAFLLDQPTDLEHSFHAWTLPGGNGEILRLGYGLTGTALPEPSTLVILLLGLPCLALQRWRRKR